MEFQPTAVDATTGSLVLSDNSLNASSATQPAYLIGTGATSPLTATQAISATTLLVNLAAAAFTPVTGSGGTAPLSYSVSPTLPAGLSMAAATGTITGTPAATRPATTYTVTVTDADSATAAATFDITVTTAFTTATAPAATIFGSVPVGTASTTSCPASVIFTFTATGVSARRWW